MEVGGQTAASGPRSQTLWQTSVSMVTIYSSGGWLPTLCQTSACDSGRARAHTHSLSTLGVLFQSAQFTQNPLVLLRLIQ